MRIIDRYLSFEILQTQVATGIVLGLVIIGGTLVRILKMSIDGSLPVDLLAPLVAVESLKSLMLLSPVILFLAILLVFGRLYRDSEMTAFQVAGVGQGALARVLLWIVLPMSGMLFGLMLLAYPWASQQSYIIQREGQQQAGMTLVRSGEFLNLRGGQAIGYAGAVRNVQHRLEQIFIFSRTASKKPAIIIAKSGSQRINTNGAVDIFSLDQGTRYVGKPGSGNFQTLQFQHYEIRLMLPGGIGGKPLNTQSSLSLLQSGKAADLAEFEWRLSIPISVLILAFLAVPLSHAKLRQGRFGQLLVAIILYAIYADLLILSKTWMAQGKTPLWLGMWWPHILLLGVLSVLWWRKQRFYLQNFWRRRI